MSAPPAQDTRQEIALLLRLLRQNTGADLDWAPMEDWDWQDFAEVCDHHDVAPFLYCRLQRTSKATIPHGLLAYLRLRFLDVSGRNYHLTQKLVQLTALLKERQIPVLAYKGPTLALTAYGDLALRSYQDLDLLVQPKDLQAAVTAMTSCGYASTPDWWNKCRPDSPRYVARHHEIPLRAPDKSYFVDLHWQLAAHQARAFRLDIDDVWRRARTVKLFQADISTLCREDLFLALCCHGTWHRWERLKWLLDIAELLRDPETLDWSRIEATIQNRPLVGAAASLAVSLARDLLEAEVPVEAAKVLPANVRIAAMAAAIRDEILWTGRTSGKNWTALLGLEGSKLSWLKYMGVQFGWLLHRVFAQIGPNERAFIPLPKRLGFLYYLIRPVRLTIKHSRRLAGRIRSDG